MARRSSNTASKFTGIMDLMNKQLGNGSAALASETTPREYIPSGCLSLDLALGGGWPKGNMVGVFGPRDVGKSTIVGLSAVREAQKQGITCAWIAVEPGFDPKWAALHGVDPEDLFIVRPNNGEQAFHALYEIVMHDDPQFGLIVFDSIGALLAESEISGKTGSDGKMKAMGQAGLITWGTKRVLMPVSKNRQVVIMLNQVRDNPASTMGGFKQPGGNALEHAEEVIVQLKNGQDRYFNPKNKDEQVGQQVVAIVLRNKSNTGSRQRAVFDFYNKATEDNDLGIDVVGDVITTGQRAGVIERAGPYYKVNGEQVMGKKGLAEVFKDPKVFEKVKGDIIKALREQK